MSLLTISTFEFISFSFKISFHLLLCTPTHQQCLLSFLSHSGENFYVICKSKKKREKKNKM